MTLMGKRLLFKDTRSERASRLRVRLVIYDNVGQRTLLAIAVDQLKCTPRARHPRPTITTMQGALHFLARNVLYEYRIPSSYSIREYIHSLYKAQSEMTQTRRFYISDITKITKKLSINILHFFSNKKYLDFSTDKYI